MGQLTTPYKTGAAWRKGGGGWTEAPSSNALKSLPCQGREEGGGKEGGLVGFSRPPPKRGQTLPTPHVAPVNILRLDLCFMEAGSSADSPGRPSY